MTVRTQIKVSIELLSCESFRWHSREPG